MHWWQYVLVGGMYFAFAWAGSYLGGRMSSAHARRESERAIKRHQEEIMRLVREAEER